VLIGSLLFVTTAIILEVLASEGAASSLRRLGLPARRSVDVATVTPFLLFAGGIAFGADWATWH